jgi:hypothetical protein
VDAAAVTEVIDEGVEESTGVRALAVNGLGVLQGLFEAVARLLVVFQVIAEAVQVSAPGELGVKLGGDDGGISNADSLILAPLAAGEVEELGGKRDGAVVVSELGVEARGEGSEEGVRGGGVGERDLKGAELGAVGVTGELAAEGLDDPLEAEAGGEGGDAEGEDAAHEVEEVLMPVESAIDEGECAASTDHQGLHVGGREFGEGLKGDVEGGEAGRGEFATSGECLSLVIGHGITGLAGLNQENTWGVLHGSINLSSLRCFRPTWCVTALLCLVIRICLAHPGMDEEECYGRG